MKKTYVTASPAGTARVAAALAKSMKGGEVIALIGDLGAGKTTFTQAFAEALGVRERVLSPTFVLMRVLKISRPRKNEDTRIRRLVHADAYRGDVEQFVNIALHEHFGDPGTVTLIEWADRIAPLLPKDVTTVRFRHLGGDRRAIEVSSR